VSRRSRARAHAREAKHYQPFPDEPVLDEDAEGDDVPPWIPEPDTLGAAESDTNRSPA
jgi:hypothetical protein